MKYILLFLTFGILWIVAISKEIMLQLDYYPVGIISDVKMGDIKWNPDLVSYKPGYFIFKGNIGEQLQIKLLKFFNSGYCLVALLTVGTTRFLTDSPENSLWRNANSQYDTQNEPIFTLNGTSVTCVGSQTGKIDETNIFSITIPSQIYCSNLRTAPTLPGYVTYTDLSPLEVLYSTPKGKTITIDLSEQIYLSDLPNVEIKIINQPRIGEIIIGNTKMNEGELYSFQSLTLVGLDYGTDTIEYSVQENIIEATGCQFNIFVCQEFCEECDPSLRPISNNHKCLSCIEGYIMDPAKKGNCCKYDDRKCLSPCIPSYINSIDYYYRECSEIYKMTNIIVYSKDTIPKFHGIDYNVTISISPRDDNTDLMCDFKKCITYIRNKYGRPIDEPITIAAYSIKDHPINRTIYYAYDNANNRIDLSDVCSYLIPYHSHDIKTVINEIPEHFKFIQDQLPDLMHLNDRTFHKYQSNDDISSRILINMTYINITDCETNLRKVYNIPPTEPFVIYVIDYKIGAFTPDRKPEYYLFTQNGKLINIIECYPKKIDIGTYFPITPKNEEKVKEAEDFASHNINVYDPQDPFFNDICVLFPLDNITDIPRQDRIKKYLQSQGNICPDTCDFVNIDYNLNKSKCKCPRPSKKNDELSLDGIKDNLLGTLMEANFEVVLCYKLVFELSIFKKNYGCWMMTIFGGIIVINMIILMIQFINPLKKELNEHHQKMFISHIPERENSILVIHQNNGINNINSPTPNQNPNSNVKMVKKETSINNMNLDIDDYQDMNYSEIIENDKRSCIIIYWNYIQLFHPIIYSFFIKSKKILKTVKIGMFLIGIMLDFSLSAFFYSDKYISNNYNNNGGFLYDLPVSLYSYLLSSVICVLLGRLGNSEPNVTKILTIKDPKQIIESIQSFIKSYTIRLIITNVLQLLLVLGLLYYVSAFCAVYQNSQIEWLKSCGISIGISMVLPFGISIIFTIMRIIIIKYNCECIYKILSFIMWFF